MALYLISIALAIVPGLLGCVIEFKFYEALLSVMVGVSGAIFTIMGIWIAHLYPGIVTALKEPKVVKVDFSEGKKDSGKLKTIVGVITVSALNMAFSIALFIVVAMYSGFSFDVQEKIILFLQPAMLTVAITQLFALASVIYVCVGFVEEVNKATLSKGHDSDV